MSIRVLVVDDSLVVRHTVTAVLSECADLEVVGTASNGAQCLRRIEQLHPDVVTLDVEMPGADGVETMVEIRRTWPLLPVIMYSTLTARGAEITMKALAAGAVDYATKPTNAPSRIEGQQQVRDALIPLLLLWGRRHVQRDQPRRRTSAVSPPLRVRRDVSMVVIGVSTGGPDALARMLPQLPATLPVPVLVVQHMPPVFTTMLAKRLDQLCAMPVVEGIDGQAIEAGHIYLAPGGRHMSVSRRSGRNVIELTDTAPENSCRPAVDVLFRTAADATDGQLMAVVLTGMGGDGTEGARRVREVGGTVFIQDEDSSVVWGMPGTVHRAGLHDAVLPLDDLSAAIVNSTKKQPAGATL